MRYRAQSTRLEASYTRTAEAGACRDGGEEGRALSITKVSKSSQSHSTTKPACRTLSNAFLKYMKLWNRLRWCCRCFFDSTIEDMFYCAQPWSKTCLLFPCIVCIYVYTGHKLSSSFHFSSVFIYASAYCFSFFSVCTPLTSYFINISYVLNTFGFFFFFYIFCSLCMCIISRIAFVPHAQGLDVRRPWV